MTPTATAPPSAKELRKTAQALSIPGWEDMSRSEMAEAIKKAQKVSANGSAPAKKKSKKVKAEVSEAPAKTKKKSKKSKTKKVVEQEVSPVKAKAKKNGVKKAAKKSADAKASASKTGFTEKTVDKALGIKLNSGVAPKALPAEGENPFRKKSNMFKIAKLLLKGGKRRVLAEKLAESTEIHPYLKGEGEIDLNDFDKRLLLGAETMLTKFGYGIQRKGRGLDGTILVFRPGGEKDPRKKAKKK